MKKEAKTKQELAEEIVLLKGKIKRLEQAEARRKMTDAGLHQENALFMDLINAQPAGIYRIRVFPKEKWRKDAWNISESAPYSVELASERFCEILGITRDVFENTPGIVEGMVHPEDKAEFARKNVEANAKLIPFQWEGRLCVGQKTIWVHFESLPRRVANGDVLWTGFLHDISERKQVEKILKESEERYQNLANVSPVGIFRTDKDGATTYVNPMWCRINRMSSAEAMGYGWLNAVHPDDRERLIRGWQEAARQHEASFTDFRLLLPDGAIAWVMGQATPELDSENQIIGYVGTVTDITERKLAEQRLHESEEQLKSLSDNLPGGLVYQIDAGPGGNERRFTYISAGVEALHGVSAADVLRDAALIYDQVYPADAKLVAEREVQAIAAMATFSAEVRVRLPSGGIRWRLFTSAPRRLATGHIIWDGIEVDISDSKRAEEERERLQALLLQAQKMESIGRLAGGVAHDFNNMLGVILIHADLAMRRFASTHPVQAGLRAIRLAGERSADLTRQLLAFARKQDAAPKVLDLNEMVQRSIDMLRRLIGEDKVLDWRPGGGLGAVRIDPSQLIQVITNLCVNARDAIAGAGHIAIETANATVDKAACPPHLGAVPGEYVRLSVGDDGCGMDRAVLDRLFEPFFTTKEVGRGTGLGLATVYGIVQQNRGFITVDSEPGKGTTFRVFLPRHHAAVAQDEPSPVNPGTLQGRETILVVEDEPEILDVICILLRQQGYVVLSAGAPGEAIRLAGEQDGEIDLLLTDVIMPEMNGRELAKSLEARYPRLKRLFMSGHTADIIADHGVLDEGVSFIAKPFSMNDLLVKVREVIGER